VRRTRERGAEFIQPGIGPVGDNDEVGREGAVCGIDRGLRKYTLPANFAPSQAFLLTVCEAARQRDLQLGGADAR